MLLSQCASINSSDDPEPSAPSGQPSELRYSTVSASPWLPSTKRTTACSSPRSPDHGPSTPESPYAASIEPGFAATTRNAPGWIVVAAGKFKEGFIHQLPIRKVDRRVAPIEQFDILQGDGIVVGTIHDLIDDHRRFHRRVRDVQGVEGLRIGRVHLAVPVAVVTGGRIFERAQGGRRGAGDPVVIGRRGETGRARVERGRARLQQYVIRIQIHELGIRIGVALTGPDRGSADQRIPHIQKRQQV